MYGINLVYNHTLALTHQCLMCTMFPHVRDNEGSYRPLTLVAPEGSIMNPSIRPRDGAHLTGFYIPSAVFGALARVIPDRVRADSAAVSNFGVIGTNERGDPMVGICTASAAWGRARRRTRPRPCSPSSSRTFPSR